MTDRKDYIFEPSPGDDDRFGAPYSIHSQGAVVGECWIKVVNLVDTEEELCDGYELGKLCQIRIHCKFAYKHMQLKIFYHSCKIFYRALVFATYI